jgi:hypothetical protein
MSVGAVIGPRATRREWIGLAVLALPCLLYAMDLTVLNLAVPRLSADLRPSSAQLLWIVDIYGFTLAGSLITMGALGDRIGRRRLLLAGAATFGVASVLAAFSASPGMLIAARAVLGVPPERAGAASAIAETSSELGGALGIALLGVIGNTIYRSQVAGTLPAGIPAPWREMPDRRSPLRSRPAGISPASSARRCWIRPGRRSPTGCTRSPASARPSRSASPSWTRSCSGASEQTLARSVDMR